MRRENGTISLDRDTQEQSPRLEGSPQPHPTPPPPEFLADMAIFRNFKIPASAQHLALPEAGQAPLFIAFISSILPSTGQPWCSDVEAALPSIITAFSPLDAPPLAFVEVGQRLEYVLFFHSFAERVFFFFKVV